jgi:catalase-peroxidase
MDMKTGDPTGCPMKDPSAIRSLLGRTNKDWWPDSLPLDILHQGGASPDPMGPDFDYTTAFKALDYAALKADLTALMTDSKPWSLQNNAIDLTGCEINSLDLNALFCS